MIGGVGGEPIWGIGLQEKITVDTIAECNIEMIAFRGIQHMYPCKVPLIGKVFRIKKLVLQMILRFIGL